MDHFRSVQSFAVRQYFEGDNIFYDTENDQNINVSGKERGALFVVSCNGKIVKCIVRLRLEMISATGSEFNRYVHIVFSFDINRYLLVRNVTLLSRWFQTNIDHSEKEKLSIWRRRNTLFFKNWRIIQYLENFYEIPYLVEFFIWKNKINTSIFIIFLMWSHYPPVWLFWFSSILFLRVLPVCPSHQRTIMNLITCKLEILTLSNYYWSCI